MSDSPFPGMDPYVEGPVHWKDFHHRFIDDLSDAITERLPDHYIARIEEDVLMLEHGDEEEKEVEPDLNVLRVGPGDGNRPPPAGGTALLEPITIPNVRRLDPHTKGYIEIRRLPDQELVSVVELLSRTNKSGEGRGLYLEKRERLLQQPVGLVEIDLLRSGRRLQLAKPLPPAHYYVFVSEAGRRPLCDVYGWTVRDPLPDVPIPLHGVDGRVVVSLAEVFRRTFRRGRYPRLTDYTAPPPAPAFAPGDAEWVAATARAATKH